MKRRNFLKATALLTAGPGLNKAIAGPFSVNDFLYRLAPADKKLDKRWIASIFERGTATVYRKSANELRYIGMPVGGICCGTLYLGGDGRLWVWDIFSKNQQGAVGKTLPIKLESFNIKEINNVYGSLYLEPATVDVAPVQQGVAIIVRKGKSSIVKRLHQDDWDEILFEATYPAASIRYIDKALGLEVVMDAFSPFIPGDAENSGIPVTIQSLSIRNMSKRAVRVEVAGWLENKTLLYTADKEPGFRRENTVFSDGACTGVLLDGVSEKAEVRKATDYGNMALGVVGKKVRCVPDMAEDDSAVAKALKPHLNFSTGAPVAMVVSRYALSPGQQGRADLLISWYTPNSGLKIEPSDVNYYSTKYANAREVAVHVAENYGYLKGTTLLWKNTWYDSTLPAWFMERTFANISTLATSTSHRFGSGRFYAWEGVGCCEGTCMHVYHYAQAMSRVFPALERDMRVRVDLGLAFDKHTGKMGYRGENTGPSIDGQAGGILRIYREYLMSADGSILKDNWDRIKLATQFVLLQDKNNDGMEDTPLENTLDAKWTGEISWIVGLCLAAVRAGQRMAEAMNDTAFAAVCEAYVRKGSENMEKYLFNGEYFIHRPDPAVGKKGIGAYNTCHIDQVLGQSWAWQVGLGRILGKDKTDSALRALWKYNFMPDVGPYIKKHPGGRFYAVAGEGGMVMNTNPANDPEPYGDAKAWQVGYFSECMSGFEHQVASHMMAEGMVEEAMVLTRAVHDRYHAVKRNPFNEIECSDHYGRAMASMGTFISACGFEYNGPKGYIGFSPRIGAEDFRAPVLVASGWGTYAQQKKGDGMSASLAIMHGELRLKKLSLGYAVAAGKEGTASVTVNGREMSCDLAASGGSCEITLQDELMIKKGETMMVHINL